MRGQNKALKFFVFFVAAASVCAPAFLRAQATLLLEEPYSYDGTFAGTGHAAVYLSRICAETPVHLRRCEPGETGTVIARYHGIAGHDWIAIPLIPYLYAVEDPKDIPLVADTKLVALLRERYLSTLDLAPEKSSGSEPRYELAGSVYDRTLYGFRVATRPEQDDELIRTLNSSPNSESYELLKRNCADFAKQIMNFYYPKSVHRSVVGDLGVMTPKQAAKTLVHSSKHHPEMQLTTFIVPQVPGLKRSKPVHGVVESLVLAKKYITPVLLFHPFVVGEVELAYWAGWRFNPGKNAMIFDPYSPDPMQGLEKPLTPAQRRSYESLLEAAQRRDSGLADLPRWSKLESAARPRVDLDGQPFLEIPLEGHAVPVGICRGNALRGSSAPELVQDLVLARLSEELKPNKPIRASATQVKNDWELLEDAREQNQAALTSRP